MIIILTTVLLRFILPEPYSYTAQDPALLYKTNTNNIDLAEQIPTICSPSKDKDFKKICDVAMYKQADWSNVIGISRDVTLEEAFEVAKENPEITFFFYMNSSMILETIDGNYRHFSKNDAIFFKGKPWWGSAEGYSDGYVKISSDAMNAD